MKTRLQLGLGFLLLTAGTALAWACGDTVTIEQPQTGIARAALRRAGSCAELDQMLRTDALTKLNERINQQILWAKQWGGYGYATPGYRDGEQMTGTSASGGAKASEYSQTNLQVAGVDEADLVKTDGKYLWVLHGQSFMVVDAWPPESLSLAEQLTLEGQPLEMLVEGGRAAIYSLVDGEPVYAAAGVVPKPFHEDYLAYGYGVAAVGGGTSTGGPTAPGATSGGAGTRAFGLGGAPLIKLTLLRLEGTHPVVEAEHWFEGNYLSSRRIDQKVFSVLTGAAHGPALRPYPTFPDGAPQASDVVVAAWEALRAESTEILRASKVEDWLPYQFSRSGTAITAQVPPCEGYYVPEVGTTQHGLTQIKVVDWTAPQAIRGPAIFGRSDTVYASKNLLALASSAYDDAYLADAARLSSTPVAVPLERTHLHAFDLVATPEDPVYVGSGTVSGHVNDQFAIDEHNGDLRVATTEDQIVVGGGSSGVTLPPPSGSGAPAQPTVVSHVFVLRPANEALSIVGVTGALAPGERIYATRFVGDRGYVVTYRQVDPLFVVDLADPTAPKVLAELTIPGFSEYMHPIDDGHLLTIGRETEAMPGGGVRPIGLSLQVFDVVDAARPALLHKYVYADPYGGSIASYDHKAFTYFAPKKLLAFPYATWSGEAQGGPKSTLEVFSVDVARGIAKKGSIDHSAFFEGSPSGYCGGYYGIEVRRGVFLDSSVISISYGGIVVSDTGDLAAVPLAVLPLPAPTSAETACGVTPVGG